MNLLVEHTAAGGCLWFGAGDIFVSATVTAAVTRTFLDEQCFALIDTLHHKYGMTDTPVFPEVDFDESMTFSSEGRAPCWTRVFPTYSGAVCTGGFLLFASAAPKCAVEEIENLAGLFATNFAMRRVERQLDMAADRFTHIAELGSVFAAVGEPLSTVSRILELSLRAAEAETGAIVRRMKDGRAECIGMKFETLESMKLRSGERLMELVMNASSEEPLVMRKNDLGAKLDIASASLILDSLLSYPLFFESRHYGSLVLINIPERRLEEPSYTAMMRTVARLAAAALTAEERNEQRLEQERIRKELAAASAIQASLIPSRFPNMRGVSISGLWKPSRTVGGDYYDVIRLDDHRVGIVIADVSGKGIPAGLLMTLSRSYLRVIAPLTCDSPGETLRRMNLHLCGEMASNKFITANYLILDTQKMTARLANAGHLPPIIIDREGSTTLAGDGAESGGIPLGIHDTETYSDLAFDLHDGMKILLYTDGLVEAKDSKRRMLGVGGIMDFLRERSGSDDLLEALWRKTVEYSGEPDDDWTCLAIGIGG